MDQETLWREYAALPDEARRRVDEFIVTLAARYANEQEQMTRDRRPLAEEPFVGMWRDRDEMADSTAWVRSIREGEWTRRDG